MEKKDIKLTCKDCGEEFLFTVGEQDFYEEKGFTNQPVRCKDCRNKRKADRNSFNGNRNNRYDDNRAA